MERFTGERMKSGWFQEVGTHDTAMNRTWSFADRRYRRAGEMWDIYAEYFHASAPQGTLFFPKHAVWWPEPKEPHG